MVKYTESEFKQVEALVKLMTRKNDETKKQQSKKQK
jgi:hypothetical protein